MDRSKTRLSTGGTVKQLLLYFLLFLAGDLLSSIAFDLLFSLIPLRARWMYLLLRSLGALGLTWLLFWLYTTHVLGRAMADFGVTLSVRGWAAAAAVLLPAGVTAVYGSLGRWTASPIPLGEAAGTIAASLALALGLADEIQSSAGGVKLDTMFVDEGFGSLDEESLQKAIQALSQLGEGQRLVGIISHVAGLKEKIDRQIVVKKDLSGGSRAEIVC